jgi:hypothetical protein
MGFIYLEKKAYANAEEQLSRAAQELLNQSSKLAEVNTLLARVSEGKGDRPKADGYFKKALNADQEYTEAYYWYAHFLASEEATRAQARATATEYLKLDPEGPFAQEAKRLL